MKASQRLKLDPRLRQLVRRGIRKAQVFIEVATPAAAKWVKGLRGVSRLVQVVDGYYTAVVESDRLRELAAGEGVIEVERVRFFRAQLDFSVSGIHGRKRSALGGDVPGGKGAVIGLIDYGLDVALKDFRDAKGRTRVAWLWDHDLTAKRGEHAPKKYRYGVEYSAARIDRGPIRHQPLNADPSVRGHGTHVAGIAAGNGRTGDRRFPAGKYAGVAPEATIVFVNLKRSEVLDHIDTDGGTIANSIKLAHGIAYCFEKAAELGMPCVVNLSLGANGGGHDGNTAVECIIDALLRQPGRAVVVAAGNEDLNDVYASGSLRRGQPAVLKWRVGGDGRDDTTPNELEVWYPRGAALAVEVVAPDGQRSGRVEPGDFARRDFSAGEEVVIDSDAETPWDGDARIHIELAPGRRKEGIRRGIWEVRLKAIKGTHVRFDAWIERSFVAPGKQFERSRFATRRRDGTITLTTPGTARRAITVASFRNSRKAAVSGFSGRGPTRDGRLKPDLAAPGDAIQSSNPGGRPARVAKSGTSMAAPHVAGVIARMLGRNAYLNSEEIRGILVRSAAAGKWSEKWGHGKLDAARAIDLLDELHGKRKKS